MHDPRHWNRCQSGFMQILKVLHRRAKSMVGLGWISPPYRGSMRCHQGLLARLIQSVMLPIGDPGRASSYRKLGMPARPQKAEMLNVVKYFCYGPCVDGSGLA